MISKSQNDDFEFKMFAFHRARGFALGERIVVEARKERSGEEVRVQVDTANFRVRSDLCQFAESDSDI